jgi:hypothetical protein
MKLSVIVSALIATGLLVGGEQSIAGSTRAAPSAAVAKSSLSAERKALITQVVMKWSSYVQQVRGVKPQDWARSMAGTFATADIANFRRAAAMTTYEGMIATLLGQKTTDAKIINSLALNGTTANLQALASPTSGLVYNIITPCRILDTREAAGGGQFAADSMRSFEAARPGGSFASQGGSATDCGIPADPAAVVLNVVSAHPAGGGYLTLFPYGVAQPLSSTVNNTVGSDVANETIVKLTVGDVADFSIYAYEATDVVADVVGYFSAPAAGSLDCVSVDGAPVTVGAGAPFSGSATCPAGYSVSGGGARSSVVDANVTLSQLFPSAGVTWNIAGKNNTNTNTITPVANCCRSPGR